ncbi:MAG: hypothetical protein KVP17_001395 [Porospora cf. gigantea B]|uniref:uncharacterized protein n=1 Tax=Porospora cf. gigantea B TaxID=2853592 RepID=UPI003571B845|nr:MAG: hypothetical protein KVP17_001395 [Porospora cf. gigantea B]
MPPIAAVQTPMDAPRVKTCQLESRPEYCVRMVCIGNDSNVKLLEVEHIPNPIEILIKVFTGQILEGLAHIHASCRNIVHRDVKPDNILFDVHQDVVEPLKNLYEACALLCARVCQGGFHADTVRWMFRFTRSLGLVVCVLTRAALMSSRCHSLGSSHLTPKVGTLLTSTELLGARSEGSSNSSRVVLSLPCAKTVVDGATWNASEIPEMKETELSERTCNPFMIAEDSELWESLETVTPAELTRMIRTVSNELTFFLDQNLTVKIADFGFAVVLAPDEDELVSSREDLDDAPNGGKKWYRPRGCGQERGRRVASMPRVATEDVGTQAYAAPEVLNQQPYSTLADMYSVGVLVCEGLCEGRIPRRGLEDRLHTVRHEDLRHITSVGRDFIRRVVTNNSRLSAEEALDHPWITGGSLESFLRE